MNTPEPCLCGDPYCPRCFVQPRKQRDPDEVYDSMRDGLIENWMDNEPYPTGEDK
jgi:hypothetical protein